MDLLDLPPQPSALWKPRADPLASLCRAEGLPDLIPALVAQDPLGVEWEGIAVGDARDEELSQLLLVHVLELDRTGEAVPSHEVLVVQILREVVVEALGSMAHRTDCARPRDRLGHDEARRRIAVAERARGRR